jgi:hypothetical protein
VQRLEAINFWGWRLAPEPWTVKFLFSFSLIFIATFACAANDIVWQLQFKDGKPQNCQIAFARVVKDEKNQPVLDADTRNDRGGWHSCIILPTGLLKFGQDYTVTLDYEILARSDTGSHFYIFARSDRLGIGADHWQQCHGEPGAGGTARLRITPTADDYVINVGIYKQGAMRIRKLEVRLGDGWATKSLGGNPALPTQPTGAQPFTVDPPSNPAGPVLNLADFGAVPDGDSPPSSGPDRNHAAFVAAIARCRELKASKLIVPKGIYRITSGDTVTFDGLTDFVFDGGGSTFLYHQIKGGVGMLIENCTRAVLKNFNLDWDWKIDPLASIGRVTKVDPAYFEMRFETAAPLDPKRWVTMNPLDERLRVPGTGAEFDDLRPKKIDKIDPETVRVWPSDRVPAKPGQLYLLRHYTYAKHAIVMASNTHLSLQYVTIFSFPGIGFISGGDQHHFELLHCRITYPDQERRPTTTTADGFHVTQSQGFIRLEGCDFGYMGDDCVNIHDNVHSGVRRIDPDTLVAEHIVPDMCPYAEGDLVEVRNGDYSPTGFTGKLKAVMSDYKRGEVTLVFENQLPSRVNPDAILFNHRYGSRNCIIRDCYFHENRARGVLCNTADWLVEGNRFFHNQHAAMLLIADVGPSSSEGFGASNIVVRNNRFESPNCVGAGDGTVIGLGASINGETTHYPLLENIRFENNQFQEMTGPAITAASFKNLVVRNNTIINREKPPIVLPMRGCLRAELGSGLWVEENTWTTRTGFASPTIFYDADTTRAIVCEGNQLNVVK